MKHLRHPSIHSGNGAFSLVELSIVLVILGLLVGGILSGQSLIRAAELRSVSTEQERYATAISTFRDKYLGLPGDLNNASNFWPTIYADGNGNGIIDMTSAATATTANPNEMSIFWMQLSATNGAALIEGSYNYVAGSGTTGVSNAMAGATNVPRGKLRSAIWNVLALGAISPANTNYYTGNYGNVFLLGKDTTVVDGTAAAGGSGNTDGVLRPDEAWNIDTKMDDGVPNQGTVSGLETQAGVTVNDCTDSGTNQYNLDGTSAISCSLVFKTGS